MALSGDDSLSSSEIKTHPSVQYDVDIWVTNSGLVSEDPSDHCISGVTKVLNGNIEEVLPLVGYSSYEVKDLIVDDILSATDEVNQLLSEKISRSPSSHLLVQNNQIFGAIIDDQNNCRVIGRVVSVVPNTGTEIEANTLFVSKDGALKIRRSKKDFNIKTLIANGVLFGIVSEGGFAFFPTHLTTDQKSDLVLVANKGYFVFDDSEVDWIRLQIGLKITEFATRRTTILPNEVLVTSRGGFLNIEDRFVVYGSGNALVEFEPLMDLMHAMRIVATNADTNENPATNEESEQLVESNIEEEMKSVEQIVETVENLQICDTSMTSVEESKDYTEDMSADNLS